MQHAREWLAGETCRRTLLYFTSNYGKNTPDGQIVTELVNSRELWFECVNNPDGYEYTFTPGNRLWRKNMADNNGNGIRGEAVDGVDPNRNHASHWGFDNEGSSDTLFRRPTAAPARTPSPRRKAIKKLWSMVDFTFEKNDHTAAELLLWPNGFQQSTAEVVTKLEAEVEAGKISDPEAARARLVELLSELAAGEPPRIDLSAKPTLIMVVGVNGTGKTTTIGKLASVLKERFGLEVIVAAADTYRAAAIEQLEAWAERAGVEMVTRQPRRRPRRGRLDALAAAEARSADVVIADTAGRLHTHGNLMEEFTKVRRVDAKRLDGAPHETLIVIDATTGQNGLRQAKAFADGGRASAVSC